MNIILLRVALLIFSNLILFQVSAQNEEEKIRSVLLKYIEGTAEGKPALLREAFHQDLNLYSVNTDGTLKTWYGDDYINIFKDGQQRNRIGNIISIDYENDAAIAKVEIKMPNNTFIDYFLLLKVNRRWEIIHKSYTEKQDIDPEPLVSQSQNVLSIQSLEAKLDSVFETTMYEQQIPGAAIIIVKDGKTLLKKGYGFTRLGEEVDYVSPDSTIFRIGSITKSFTALALLQQIDRDKLNLNDDINQHLTSIQVPKSFESPITPFHLLTHSSGLDELKGRRTFHENEQVPLGDYLKTRLTRIRRPGEITAYSTFGIALSGLLVEDLNISSLEKYMKDNIWNPLGMQLTSIDLPDEYASNTALGYEIHNNINIPQPWEWYHTFPASSINSTAENIGQFMVMLLNKGKHGNNRIISEDLAEKMLTQQLSIHPEADGFTFGLYERKWNGIATVGHGGDMLGYSSYMTLVPEENLGIFVVHHHEGTNLRYLAIETSLTELIDEKPSAKTLEKLEEELSPFAGEYVWLSNCQTCSDSDEQNRWNLTIHDDHTLSGFNRTFYQVGSLLFESTDGQRTMSFKKDENGNIKYMSLGNINVFEKIK